MRRAARADVNQAALVGIMRIAGAKVLHLHRLGGGIPDLLVLYHQRFALAEVKQPGEGLNAEQEKFHAEWPVFVVRTVEDVWAMLKTLRG